jgi:hypothetical protein
VVDRLLPKQDVVGSSPIARSQLLAVDTAVSTAFPISGMNFFGFLTSNLHQLFAGAVNPRLLVSLWVVALMFTPYLRVAASLIYFTFESHNLKYTVFTFVVFTVLTYSLFLR